MAFAGLPSDKTAVEFVAGELERLMSLPLDTPQDVTRWDVECGDFETALQTRFPTFQIEHHVWHYFDDADIRQKDPNYRHMQHEAIADYVARLRASH
jgi:hypothetical protein